MGTFHFTNGRVITPQGERDSLYFCDGVVDDGFVSPEYSYDLEGDFLIPGLIELHTDNLEKHFTPRSGVQWPAGLASVMAHDIQMTGSGVTTVFDAITVGEPENRKNRKALFDVSLKALHEASECKVLRANHFLHLRCELAGDDVLEIIDPYLDYVTLRLMSVMDHTPGQRQYRDLEIYKASYGLQQSSASEVKNKISFLQEKQQQNGPKNLHGIVAICRERGLPLASHDDTTVEHIHENIRYGVSIAEFPTTLEAAQEAKQHNLAVVMGAPNIVRGGSHSGNVSAAELAREGLLDILSSDYMPASLLHAAFLLPELTGMPLQQALETVTSNPAKAVGLNDRGALEAGKRADAVQVRLVDGVPVVRAVWQGGQRTL